MAKAASSSVDMTSGVFGLGSARGLTPLPAIHLLSDLDGNGRVDATYIDGNGNPPAGRYLNFLWAESGTGLPAWMGAGIPPSAYTQPGVLAPVKAVSLEQMRAQIQAWRVAAIVAIAKPDSLLGDYLTVLLGPPQVAKGDVLGWRRDGVSWAFPADS